MSKRLILLLLLFFSGVGICLPEATAAEGGEYTTKGMITFTPNEEITDPLNPSDPLQPIQPVDPIDPNGPNPGTGGALSIDYASSLDFGAQKITTQDKIYLAKVQKYQTTTSEEKQGPNYIQVSDKRGSQAGWRLQVKQAEQFKTEEGESLSGAQVTFKNGRIATIAESVPPTASTSVVIQPNNMLKDVLVAEKNTGAGTFLVAWGDEQTAAESIELFVPGSATKLAKAYTTTFTWCLTDAPPNA